MYRHLSLVTISVAVCCYLMFAGNLPSSADSEVVKAPLPNNPDCKIIGLPENTRPDSNRKAEISIQGLLSDVPVDPCQVESLRPDIFNKGYFSVFDCLVHICNKHNIQIKYHFDSQLRCHIIDSIGSKKKYYFNRFNKEQTHGRAGFTYSLGEKVNQARRGRRGFGDNNFHMTTDIRVIVSPEYMHWKWTDLSRRKFPRVRP